MTIEGLTIQLSGRTSRETMDGLVAAVTKRGMTVFARIDHAAAAAAVGLELRYTEVLIFGHANGGTPLMQGSQTAGIDLPLKGLSWQDEAGRVWLGYNDPVWIADRHRVEPQVAATIRAMREMLAAVSREACAK